MKKKWTNYKTNTIIKIRDFCLTSGRKKNCGDEWQAKTKQKQQQQCILQKNMTSFLSVRSVDISASCKIEIAKTN